MTNSSSSGDSEAQPPRADRLAQIEALLQQSVIASNERMTQIEQARERDRQESNERLTTLEQLTQSNSRAIQAMLDAQTEARLEREQFRSEITQTTASINEAIQRLTTLNEGVVNMLASLDDDRPTILRRLRSIENKVDQLLEQQDGGQ